MSLQSLDRVLSKTSDRSVGDIIASYGSNVQRLKMDAATGKIDPTKAVMAMMAIQRIVAANTQPPPGTTVAQDTGIAPPPQQMGMNAITPSVTSAAPQQPPMRMAYGGQVAVSNNQVPSPAMERGLAGLPVPDNMFDYAGGGMVAFADGGNVKRFQGLSGSYVGKPRQQLMMLLQALPEGDPRRLRIQEELRNLDAMEVARTRGGAGAMPVASSAAEPAAEPAAAPTAMRGTGIKPPRSLSEVADLMFNAPKFAPPTSQEIMTEVDNLVTEPTIAEPSREKISSEQLEAAKKFGYDPTLTKTQIEENEKEREDLKNKRKESADMAILKAGLNIMAGTSPFAFVNIGKGGSEAAKEFATDIRDLQKMQLQLKKDEQALKRAANQDALQQSEKSEAAYREALRIKESRTDAYERLRATLYGQIAQNKYGFAQAEMNAIKSNMSSLASAFATLEAQRELTAAYGGDRRSEYARAVDTNAAEMKRLRDEGDPEYVDKTDTQIMLMASDKVQRQMRTAEPKEAAAAATSQRAETDLQVERNKEKARLRFTKEYRDKAKVNKVEADAWLENQLNKSFPLSSTRALRPVATPSASDPLGLGIK